MSLRITLAISALVAICLCVSRGRGDVVSPFTEVVARVSLTSQTDAIPETTLFTTTASGIYRVSAYAEVTNPSSETLAQSVCGKLSWSDDSSVRQGSTLFLNSGSGCLNLGGGISGQATSVIRVKAQTPVTFQISVPQGNSGSAQYGVFIVAERMWTPGI